MENEKKQYSVQVPFQLIISPKQFNELYLYIILKVISKGRTTNIYSNSLLERLGWKDTRTLKKYLRSLKSQNYITYDFEDLPQTETLKISFTPIRYFKKTDNKKESYYKQVTESSILKIIKFMYNCKVVRYSPKNREIESETYEDLKERAVMLFYYYKMKYNSNYGYGFASYKEIHTDTGISNEYIKIINDKFNFYNIVKVENGKKDTKKGMNKKERNKYIPLIQ
jgi:hypothetical protein